MRIILLLISVCTSVPWYHSWKIFVHYISLSQRTVFIRSSYNMNIYKIALLGTLGVAWIALTWSIVFVYCVIMQIGDLVSTLAIKQEWNNCIVSSIHLPVRFDWRNFAFALAIRIPIAVSFTTFGLITSVAVHCLMSTRASAGLTIMQIRHVP